MFLGFIKHKWQRITTVVLASIVALILIAAFFVNLYWSPILSGKVKEIVLKSSDSLYTVSFSSAELHILRGTIIIHNITLIPDTGIYNRRFKQHLAPNNLAELHVKRIILSHIHPFKLYFQHRLEIGEVEVNEPDVNLTYKPNRLRDTVIKQNKTAWQKISKTLKSIHIGSILLGDVKLKYKDYSGNSLVISELKEMNLSAMDLLIDSATQTDKSRLLYCKDIIAELNNYTAKSPNGLYSYKFNHLKLSTSKSQLNIEGLTLKPINAEAFFAKSHRDRFTLRLDSLQLNQFDYLTYHKYRTVDIRSIYLSHGTVEIYGGRNPSQKKENKVKSFPNVGLYDINADLKVDSVRLHHINVLYTEFNKKANETGTVSFDNTNGRFLNVTTNKAALQKNDIASVDLTSYFMNRGRLDVSFTFNLTDEKHSFSYRGKLGSMDLSAINPAAMPLGMVKINSGTVKRMDFNVRADENGAHGNVGLLYNNLKISILKPDTNFDNLKKRPVASLFANLFLVKHDNPDSPNEQPRSAHVDYLRTPETPFFKFVWQTLFTGIKPCAGFDKKTQDAAVAMQNQQTINKQNHMVKKAERQQRRAARRARRAARKAAKTEAAGDSHSGQNQNPK